MNTIDYTAIEEQLGPEIANALRLLAAQRAKGEVKYGQGVEDNTSVDLAGWLQHAREELADGLVYLQRADRMHADELRECRQGTIHGLLRELRYMIENLDGSTDEFKMLAVQNWIRSYKEFSMPVIELNVQPSELQKLIAGDVGLIAMSKDDRFPFKKRVQVVL